MKVFDEIGKSLPYSDDGFLEKSIDLTFSKIIAQKRKRNLRFSISIAASVFIVVASSFLFQSEQEVESYDLSDIIAQMSDSELDNYIYCAENDYLLGDLDL